MKYVGEKGSPHADSMIAINGLPISAQTGLIDAGGTGVGFGFLGGIVGGFLAGYVILGLEKLLSGLPKNLDGLKAIFLYPLLSTFVVGLVMHNRRIGG